MAAWVAGSQPQDCKKTRIGALVQKVQTRLPHVHLPLVPYSRVCPRRSPPQSLEAEGSPGSSGVLNLPHFPVFPWTRVSHLRAKLWEIFFSTLLLPLLLGKAQEEV